MKCLTCNVLLFVALLLSALLLSSKIVFEVYRLCFYISNILLVFDYHQFIFSCSCIFLMILL